jgi:ferredoxin-NADP reductase
VRLTAPDGYTAVRAYSLASTGPGDRVELAVDVIEDGEVSPYLVHELREGDQLEFRGPLGRWFVWEPTVSSPVQLVAGGSGVVPLLAMVRAHRAFQNFATGAVAPIRMLYSVRSPDDVFYEQELMDAAATDGFDLTMLYTREAPDGQPVGRINLETVAAHTFAREDKPAIFICGPNGFVAAASDLLIALGHDPLMIKTERFGGV